MTLIRFWVTHQRELAALVAQHVLLVSASTLAAIAVGLPLGMLAARRPRLASPLVGLANIVQTVPSLAMFGFLLPVPLVGGVGARAAIVVLILYGLLPIVRTTIAGLNGIDPAIREAGVAMGMTPGELLRLVELPLALPSIVAGIRVAAVVGVGSATIAAAIGAGGLGEYIYRGLSMVDSTVILAGAIPAALLALVVDGGLLLIERRLSAGAAQKRRERSPPSPLVVLLAFVGSSAAARAPLAGGAIVVGSKNFTEQMILGELVAQTIERDAGLACRAAAEPGGHAHLRSRADDGRCRRLCRVHRDGAHGDLPPAGGQRFDSGVRHGARAVRANRTHAAAAARLQQYVCDSRAWRRRARASGSRRLTMWWGRPRAGTRGSGTSFSSGLMVIRDWRRGTGCDFPDRPESWIYR